MEEYSNLELMDLIGDLELWGYNHLKPLFEGKHDTSHQMYKAKSKLYDLMVKYKVSINREFDFVWLEDESITVEYDFKSESEIPRAIIMCILNSENVI